MSKSSISVGTKIWADKINAAWQASVEGIFRVGQVLIDAKEALPQRDFEKLINHQLRFDGSTARRLIIVAEDARLSAQAHRLPPSWSTLYEMTKLTDDEFEQALTEGAITKQTQRAEVKRLRAPKPTVTDAEYHNVEESPATGIAVSADGLGKHVEHPPQDDREGGDSASSLMDSSVMADRAERARSAAVAPSSQADESKSMQDFHHWISTLRPPREDMIALYVDPTEPAPRFAIGLAIAMSASKEMSPEEAVRLWPPEMPLLSYDLDGFLDWLEHVAIEFRALRSDAAE
jgi:hypothetical protein